MTYIPIAEYRPDVADLVNQFSNEIFNVFPAYNSYIPAPGFSLIGIPLPKRNDNSTKLNDNSTKLNDNSTKLNESDPDILPLGSYPVKDFSSGVHIFLGTEHKIFRIRSLVVGWEDVTQPGVTYSATRENPWSFAVFGEMIIAVNINDNPQCMMMTNVSMRDLGNPPNPPDPSPYTVKPPKASMVKNWGNFVALMGLNQGTVTDPKTEAALAQYNKNTIYWSGLNDPDFWYPGQRSCDLQNFYDGGVVQGTNETSNPIIFMENAIYFATFVPGSVYTFSFQKIHDKRGAKTPSSIAYRGALVFYADEGGFFMITSNGVSPAPIGFEKVDRTFFRTGVNLNTLKGVIDPFYSRVYWAIDTKSIGTFDQILCYDWILEKWSLLVLPEPLYDFASLFTFGVDLEGFDVAYPSIEKIPDSLDSRLWNGGSSVLMGVGWGPNNGLEIGSFSGPNMEVSVVTHEVGDTGRQFQRISGVNPITDCDNVLVSAGRRNVMTPSINWTQEISMSFNTGYAYLRSRAKYHRFRIRIKEGENWTHLDGIDVTFKPGGVR